MTRKQYLRIKNFIKSEQHLSGWRTKIKERDNNKCQICFKEGNTIHHKLPIGMLIWFYDIQTKKDIKKCKIINDTNWGITLCEQDHKEIDKEYVR